LVGLEQLDLRDNQISEISGLEQLVGLEQLDLRTNGIKTLSIGGLDRSSLQVLAFNDYAADLPPELLSKHSTVEAKHDNCLPAIRAWYAALDAEPPTKNRLFKVVVCGNGTVGKTQIINRLLERPFQEKTDSTHGIQIEQSTPLPLVEEAKDFVQLHLWDFGGQEVYHQTHRLFLAYRAIYMVVFDADTYDVSTQHDPKTEHSEASRSLAFWLSEIKARDNDSPVIVVQNKVDDHSFAPINFQLDLPKDLLPDENLAISAKTERNFNDLREALYRRLYDSREYNMPLPASWHRAREATLDLVAKAKKGGEPKLSLDKYLQEVCDPAGVVEKSHQKALLQYFHATGVLFHDVNYLPNAIILNQQWALDAIYAVLQRTPDPGSAVAQFRERCELTKGRFRIYDLPLPAEKYAEEDRRLFLGFMESARICFKLPSTKQDEEPLYQLVRELSLAPTQEISDIWQSQEKGAVHFRYHHRYHLHAGIIEAFIIRMATHCQLHQLWRNGALVNWRQSWAWINVNYFDKEIVISVTGPQRDYLLHAIRNTFDQIQGENSTIDEQVSLDVEQWVQLTALRDAIDNQAVTVYTINRQAKIECQVLRWALQRDAEAKFDIEGEVPRTVVEPHTLKEEPEVNKKQPAEEIGALIADGRIKQALAKLVLYFPQAQAMQGEFKRVNRQYDMGSLTAQEWLAKHSEISNRILRLAKDLDKTGNQGQKEQIVAEAQTDFQVQLDRIEAKVTDNNQRIQSLQADVPIIMEHLENMIFSKESIEALIAHTAPLLQRLSILDAPPAAIKHKAYEALNPSLPVSQKIKLVIPLIPGILLYETELSGKPQDVLRDAWNDLKAGKEEGVRRVFLKGGGSRNNF
jgi:GTPase SAR1 family protein